MTAPNHLEEPENHAPCFASEQNHSAARMLSDEYLNASVKRAISSVQLKDSDCPGTKDNRITEQPREASDATLTKPNIDDPDKVQFSGELFLIGGVAVDSFNDLVASLPKDAKIVTVGLASEQGDDSSLSLARDFENAGIKAQNITAYCLGAAPPDAAYNCVDKLPENFDLIYFGGGDQSLLKQRFLEVEKVRQALKDGCIVAGSSPGTAVMSSEMIAGGDAASLTHAHGFSLLPWAITDTHVHERDREDRDLSALYEIGAGKIPVIGIDEDTRVLFRWEDGHLIGEVGGDGIVHIFKTRDQGLNVTSTREVKPQLTYGMDGAGKGKAALVWELKAGDKFVLL